MRPPDFMVADEVRADRPGHVRFRLRRLHPGFLRFVWHHLSPANQGGRLPLIFRLRVVTAIVLRGSWRAR